MGSSRLNSTNRIGLLIAAGLALVGILGIVAAVVSYQHPERRVARLVEVLQENPDPARRAAAARELGAMGAAGQSAAHALAKALDDEGRYLTASLLIPVEHPVYQEAFESLKRLGGQQTADAMADILRSSCGGDGRRSGRLAPQVLLAIGNDAAHITPQLVDLLGECRDLEVSKGILSVLDANVPEAGSQAARELLNVLPIHFIDYRSDSRIYCARLQLALAPGENATLARLIDATQTQDNHTAEIGDLALRNFGTSAIPELVARLDHINHPAVVELLRTFPAADVLPALRDSLESPAPQRRRAAGLVITGMPIREGDLDLIHDLARELKEGPAEPRAGVCVALLRRTPDSKDAASLLTQLSADEPGDSPFAVETLYGGITFNDLWAIPWLDQSLMAAQPAVRKNAAMALERFGPGARSALPALLAALQDKDPEVQKAAAKAVAAIDR